jgi:hypothetical protein
MKVSVFIVIGLMLSGSVAAVSLTYERHTQIESLSLSFSEPSFVDDD